METDNIADTAAKAMRAILFPVLPLCRVAASLGVLLCPPQFRRLDSRALRIRLQHEKMHTMYYSL